MEEAEEGERGKWVGKWGLEEEAEEGERGKRVRGLRVGLGRWGFGGLEEKERAWGGERGKRVGGLSVVLGRAVAGFG